MASRTILSTITSKGQVTLPVSIRQHLKLRERDRVAFVVHGSGRVELQAPRYSSVAALTGAAGSMGQNLSLNQLREIAYQDRFAQVAEGDD